jgi:hypothetical protein
MTPDILTCGASYFNFLEPEKSEVSIETIAHSLSNICRFTGHSKWHYSVAQHSLLVSYLVPPEYAFQGLMHDIAEAYIGDVSSPLKQLLPDFKAIERRVEAAIFPLFGLPTELHPCVKKADMVAYITERRDLMPHLDDLDDYGLEPHDFPILRLEPEDVERGFMERFLQLTSENWRS